MDYDKLIIHLFFNSENKLKLNNLTKYKKNVKYHNTWPRLQHYINNRYNDSKSLKETLYRILYNIEVRPVCKSCGNDVEFIGKSGKLFRNYCCNSCSANSKETINKKKETQLKNWGTENCYDSEKYQQYLLETRGAKYIYDLPEVKEKRKQTLINNFGTDKITSLKEIRDKITNSYISKYGVEHPMKLIQVRKKIKNTCLIKYGVEHAMQSEEIRNKKYLTQKKNNTFNTSKSEDESYKLLSEKFPDIIRQYKSELYPFYCDFYIPSLDLYIECNYHWTHGNKLYEGTNEDNVLLEEWKTKNTNYYNNAIYTWTNLDIRKYNIAKENRLNYKIFYNIDELKNWLIISINYDKNLFIKELNYFKTTNGRYSLTNYKNYIVKYYQQENFYKTEKDLWINENIRYKLVNNRIKYLNKEEFTTDELLRGFKISGIHYGYSHFNPLIIKQFLEDTNAKICYDPCGGWGHRILGSTNIDKYIYNDLSYHTYIQCKNMCKKLNIDNVDFYNNDCRYFIPNDDFDVMFTCPPYFNLENYECGDFKNIEEFNNFIDLLFEIFYKKDSCKVFGLVIREDLIDTNKYIYTKRIDLNNKTSHYNISKKRRYNEILYIFNK